MREQLVFPKDIQGLNDSMGWTPDLHALPDTAPLMSGLFRHHAFDAGLSLHAANALELQHLDSALSLPPCLSFNLLLSGEVHFSFAGKSYCMRNESRTQAGLETASCTAIVNDREERLTRHLREGIAVQKLNVFVERNWLQKRCHSDTDQHELTGLFAHTGVFTWTPSAQVLATAQTLLDIKTGASFASRLQLEYLTIQLLDQFIGELKQAQLGSGVNDSVARAPSRLYSSLQARIDNLLACRNAGNTINDMAEKLNMSARTLQRQFKAQNGLSVSDYLRQQRMDAAKQALLQEWISIGEASYRAGFNHASNFVSAFKKMYGLTPTECLKQHELHGKVTLNQSN